MESQPAIKVVHRLPMVIVSLLATALFIGYFDRGLLATASPLIQSEFGLSKTELGFLFSAFYWSYAPVQPLAGWLAQRFDVRYVLGCGVALWGLSTTLMGLSAHLAVMLGLRVALGLGESLAYPSNAKFLGQRAAVDERGRANGLIAVGQALGPTAGTVLSGLVMAIGGWRPAFVAFSLLSLAWLVPWHFATRDGLRPTEPTVTGPCRIGCCSASGRSGARAWAIFAATMHITSCSRGSPCCWSVNSISRCRRWR